MSETSTITIETTARGLHALLGLLGAFVGAVLVAAAQKGAHR